MTAIARIERYSAEILKLVGVTTFLILFPALLIPDGGIAARIIGLAAVLGNLGSALYAPDFRWSELSLNPFRNGAVARTMYAMLVLLFLA